MINTADLLNVSEQFLTEPKAKQVFLVLTTYLLAFANQINQFTANNVNKLPAEELHLLSSSIETIFTNAFNKKSTDEQLVTLINELIKFNYFFAEKCQPINVIYLYECYKLIFREVDSVYNQTSQLIIADKNLDAAPSLIGFNEKLFFLKLRQNLQQFFTDLLVKLENFGNQPEVQNKISQIKQLYAATDKLQNFTDYASWFTNTMVVIENSEDGSDPAQFADKQLIKILHRINDDIISTSKKRYLPRQFFWDDQSKPLNELIDKKIAKNLHSKATKSNNFPVVSEQNEKK